MGRSTGSGFYGEGVKFFSARQQLTPPSLFGQDTAMARADYAELKLPSPGAGKVPHVFEKLGMMAEAIEEDLDDEEAFMEHMQGDIWAQAQALRAAGEI